MNHKWQNKRERERWLNYATRAVALSHQFLRGDRMFSANFFPLD